MPAKKKQISLLPQSDNPSNPLSQALNWLTSVGRVIIIFTEFIVVIAFLSRFWLDRQNSDLSETIRQQNAIISSTQDFERQFNQFQERLQLISKLYNHKNTTQALTSLFKSTPPSVYFQNLKIDPQSDDLITNLAVISYDNQSIIEFITNLILNPNISKVVVNNIKKEPKIVYFNINLTIYFDPKFASNYEI